MLAAFCGGALAEEDPPPFLLALYGQNSGEGEVISGECHSLNSRDTAIGCDFAHVEIVKPPAHVNEATQVDLDVFEYVERPNPALAARLENQTEPSDSERRKGASRRRGRGPIEIRVGSTSGILKRFAEPPAIPDGERESRFKQTEFH